MIDGFLSGAFDPSEFLEAHNQGRTAIIVGVLLVSAQFDNFDQNYIEYLIIVFVSITLVNVIYLSYLLLKGRLLAKGVIVLVRSFALFSLAQWENFLLSINVTFFAVVAFSVVSIVAMARCLLGQYKRMTAATFFAVAVVTSELALLSMGGGVVVWVVNLVQIALAIVLFQVRALRVCPGTLSWIAEFS
jgi:hypothetical protein